MGCSLPNSSTTSTGYFFKLQFYSFPIFNHFGVYWNKSSFTGTLELCLVEKVLGQDSSDCIYYQWNSRRATYWQLRETEIEAVTYKFKKLVSSDFLHLQVLLDVFLSSLQLSVAVFWMRQLFGKHIKGSQI